MKGQLGDDVFHLVPEPREVGGQDGGCDAMDFAHPRIFVHVRDSYHAWMAKYQFKVEVAPQFLPERRLAP